MQPLKMVGGSFGRYTSFMTGYVYLTASRKRGTIYIGVTNDLGRRMPEHKSGEGSRFTGRYGVERLVWYEKYFDVTEWILGSAQELRSCSARG
jgi:putative endonuclease